MLPILTIAGSDCSGGAGIQADLKTFSAHGLFGMSVVTSVVAENTVRVIDYQDVTPPIIKKQIDAIFEDIEPAAIKIGMLSTVDTMNAVASKLEMYKPHNVVIDPVMYAKNGCALMDPDSIDALISKVLPHAHLITPNIPEAERITGKIIKTRDDMEKAAKMIHKMGCPSVLIKGGHRDEDAADLLFSGDKFHWYEASRIDTKNTHGTGCTLSSAIASNLALGYDIASSIANSKEYITTAICHSLSLGKGHGPTHHFYSLYKRAGMKSDSL